MGNFISSHQYQEHNAWKYYEYNVWLNYEGNFLNGTFNGEGTLQWIDPRAKRYGEKAPYDRFSRDYIGEWKDGVPHGRGKMGSRWETYEGNWSNGKKHGYGKHVGVLINTTYEGEFENDLPHGKGQLLFEGNKINGIWENGEIVSCSFDKTRYHRIEYDNIKSNKCAQACINNGFCTETSDGECIVGSDSDCQKSKICEENGQCTRVMTGYLDKDGNRVNIQYECHQGSDYDCGESQECCKSERCKYVHNPLSDRQGYCVHPKELDQERKNAEKSKQTLQNLLDRRKYTQQKYQNMNPAESIFSTAAALGLVMGYLVEKAKSMGSSNDEEAGRILGYDSVEITTNTPERGTLTWRHDIQASSIIVTVDGKAIPYKLTGSFEAGISINWKKGFAGKLCVSFEHKNKLLYGCKHYSLQNNTVFSKHYTTLDVY